MAYVFKNEVSQSPNLKGRDALPTKSLKIVSLHFRKGLLLKKYFGTSGAGKGTGMPNTYKKKNFLQSAYIVYLCVCLAPGCLGFLLQPATRSFYVIYYAFYLLFIFLYSCKKKDPVKFYKVSSTHNKSILTIS